jgi:SAM-dependent methyltransferase
VDVVARLHQRRRVDFRKARRLGRYDGLPADYRPTDLVALPQRYRYNDEPQLLRAEAAKACVQMLNAAQREAGLTIHEGTLPGVALPDESFDVVTMWQALEHVPSPKATLEAVREVLRPSGRLLVVVPRLDSLEARWFGSCWFGLELPRHLTHFTEATLRRHVEAAGFGVEACRSFRRPAILRRSFAQLADQAGRPLYRRLAASRLVAGAMSGLALVAGRTGQFMLLARGPAYG